MTANNSYMRCERSTQTRGVRERVRVLTLCVGSRRRGWNSSITTPINRTMVDHIRPQNHLSALFISNALAATSRESKTVLGCSDSDLPLWPVWLAIGLITLFCCYTSSACPGKLTLRRCAHNPTGGLYESIFEVDRRLEAERQKKAPDSGAVATISIRTLCRSGQTRDSDLGTHLGKRAISISASITQPRYT
jgi:hypothetical protein